MSLSMHAVSQDWVQFHEHVCLELDSSKFEQLTRTLQCSLPLVSSKLMLQSQQCIAVSLGLGHCFLPALIYLHVTHIAFEQRLRSCEHLKSLFTFLFRITHILQRLSVFRMDQDDQLSDAESDDGIQEHSILSKKCLNTNFVMFNVF